MVHKFKFENNNFVVDSNSGAVHVVDDIFYDMLSYLDGNFFDYTENYLIKKLEDKYSANEIKETYKEIISLYNNEKLFSKDTYEKLATEEKLSSPIKAICLNIAHDCNLACKYCFASKGDFGCGKKELMPLETAKKAVDFLIEKSGAASRRLISYSVSRSRRPATAEIGSEKQIAPAFVPGPACS